MFLVLNDWQEEGGGESKLTSIWIKGSKHGLLLCWAGAVGNLHLQLIPGGLLQVIQDVALGERGALGRGPGGGVYGSVLQHEGCDWTAAVVPSSQVEPGPGRVDAGEEVVLFGELWFWDGKPQQLYNACST